MEQRATCQNRVDSPSTGWQWRWWSGGEVEHLILLLLSESEPSLPDPLVSPWASVLPVCMTQYRR